MANQLGEDKREWTKHPTLATVEEFTAKC